MTDWLPASAWLDEMTPSCEGDAVEVTAYLTDVDEVVVRIALKSEGSEHPYDVLVHLDRIHAIALAGLLAKAATTPQTELPHGHGVTGPLA